LNKNRRRFFTLKNALSAGIAQIARQAQEKQLAMKFPVGN
jgi:hypothetical protein